MNISFLKQVTLLLGGCANTNFETTLYTETGYNPPRPITNARVISPCDCIVQVPVQSQSSIDMNATHYKV